MRLRELVKYLEVEKLVPVHYYNELSNREYATCKYMTDEELDDYLNKTWTSKKIYDDSELGIYLGDISIDEVYDLEEKRNPVSLEMVMNQISYIFPVWPREESLIFAIYVVLHEVGHWLDFKASGKTSLEYSLWDSDFRSASNKYTEIVYEMPDDSYEKIQYARKAVDMYKNIPSEKVADIYAYKNIKEKLELIKHILKV